jgi:hypothetical protein
MKVEAVKLVRPRSGGQTKFMVEIQSILAGFVIAALEDRTERFEGPNYSGLLRLAQNGAAPTTNFRDCACLQSSCLVLHSTFII